MAAESCIFVVHHGRGKVAAFLDRAASLCHFLAVCCACSDSGTVCLKVLQSCQLEQVDSCTFDRMFAGHFVGAATLVFELSTALFLALSSSFCLIVFGGFFVLFLKASHCTSSFFF